MAVFNEILVGRFNRYLQKFTGIKAAPPVPALGTELMAVLDVNSFKMEDRYLFQIDSFWINNGIGPVAAQNSVVRFRNPAGSKVVAVVEFLGITSTVAEQTAPFMQIQVGSINADLSTTNLIPPLDPRSGRKGSSLITSVQNNIVGGGGGFQNIVVFPTTANSFFGLTLYDDMEIPLLPGIGIQVVTTAVNTLLNVDMKWRERALEDSEQF